MQNRNSGQQGFGLIKLMIKMAMLTVVLMLVAITVPKVIQSLGYSQGRGWSVM
jgi:Tfp pilus assembly protein FimT